MRPIAPPPVNATPEQLEEHERACKREADWLRGERRSLTERYYQQRWWVIGLMLEVGTMLGILVGYKIGKG